MVSWVDVFERKVSNGICRCSRNDRIQLDERCPEWFSISKRDNRTRDGTVNSSLLPRDRRVPNGWLIDTPGINSFISIAAREDEDGGSNDFCT